MNTIDSEAEIIYKFKHGNFAQYHYLISALGTIVNYSNGQEIVLESMDLTVVETSLHQTIGYVKILKRFNYLNNLFGHKIIVNIVDGVHSFDVDGHQFSTLDEVEKAYKNKAFL